jgi:hypothetical protein
MTRRELGAAFASGGDLFAVEFGLMRGYGTTAVKCELVPPFGYVEWGVAVMNVGLLPALDVMVASARYEIMWAEDGGVRPTPGRFRQSCEGEPPYLPISRLPPGSDVVLICLRDEYADPIQDVLVITWKTPDGQAHRSEQSWSWTPRWVPPTRAGQQ